MHKPNLIELLERRRLLASASGDFNGDGFDDMVIGAPREDLARKDAGALTVIYGTADGLDSEGNQFWHLDLPGIRGKVKYGDSLGSTLAVGDFDDDGFDDLAAGAPRKKLGSDTQVGAILILYGSDDGLTDQGHRLLTEDSKGIRGRASEGDLLGAGLASGDFDGDGFGDLAAGAFGQTVEGIADAGAIHILYGSDLGITGRRDQIFTQETRGIPGTAEVEDRFGERLATGDFDGNGRDDLVVGVYFEDVADVADAGSVYVLYGRKSGLRARESQRIQRDAPAIQHAVESNDWFGERVVTGDFDDDGLEDIALTCHGQVGAVPFSYFGTVYILFGNEDGSVGERADSFTSLDFAALDPDITNIGSDLAAADFDGDGISDLAASWNSATVNGVDDCGTVVVVPGSLDGIQIGDGQVLDQGIPELGQTPSGEEYFGAMLGAGDFDGDDRADLIIGVPEENLNGIFTREGLVHVLYGALTGITTLGNQIWTQDSDGILDESESRDFFGE